MPTPRLNLPLIQPSQAQKHVTHNEALEILDAVVHLRVLSWDAAEPPAAPAAGDVHEVGAGATGAWAGQDGRLALWDGAGWLFLAPAAGWLAWDGATIRSYSGSAWAPFAPPLQGIDGVGIRATSDPVNRLVSSAAATLLTHDGAGHQLKVNKAAATDTASLLFQSAWTGHAEMGLAGSNDFSVKVSDGGAWFTALSAARATGVLTVPQGAVIGGTVTGAAVMAGAADGTAGRLLTTGAYGMGGALPPIGDCGATGGDIVPGLYAYDAGAGSSGGPTGVTRGTLLHSRRGAALGETQLMVVETGTTVAAGTVLGRARTGGAWSGWASGGGPTSGSGATGSWIRHADGTQTCWHTLATSATAETAWTFPAAFASASGLAVTGCVVAASGGLVPRVTGKSATSVSVSTVSSSGTRGAGSVDLVAWGRWL